MDARLRDLAIGNDLCCGGYNYIQEIGQNKGKMYCCGNYTPEEWNAIKADRKLAWIKAEGDRIRWAIKIIPLMWEQKFTNTKHYSRSSYGMKHDVEHAFRDYAKGRVDLHKCYLSNGELLLACLYLGWSPYTKDGPNGYFRVKSKFKGLENKGGKQKAIAEENLSRLRITLRTLSLKEELVAYTFHPDRVVRLGGPDWLECV